MSRVETVDVTFDRANYVLSEVSGEIGRLYSPGYYCSNKTHNGGFYQIRVEVYGLSGAQISAREGYETNRE